MTGRRAFLVALAGGMLAAMDGPAAQTVRRVARIGFLAFSQASEARTLFDAFRLALAELGYVEGRDIVFEFRSADGNIERFPELAAELVRLAPDLIVAGSTPPARAARQATATIPIVSPSMGDPVGDGLVATLARPGGNVTGLTFLGPELVAKRLELLTEAIPGFANVAVLRHPGAFSEKTSQEMLDEAAAAARSLRVRLSVIGVNGAGELDRAFSTMARDRADALIVFPSTMLFNLQRQIAGLAAKQKLPAIGIARGFADGGGLMAYGASIPDLFRRAATYADKILKGAKPAVLPVERPTKFELVVNLKTAKSLGLTIPQSLLLRADEVIQ